MLYLEFPALKHLMLRSLHTSTCMETRPVSPGVDVLGRHWARMSSVAGFTLSAELPDMDGFSVCTPAASRRHHSACRRSGAVPVVALEPIMRSCWPSNADTLDGSHLRQAYHQSHTHPLLLAISGSPPPSLSLSPLLQLDAQRPFAPTLRYGGSLHLEVPSLGVASLHGLCYTSSQFGACRT